MKRPSNDVTPDVVNTPTERSPARQQRQIKAKIESPSYQTLSMMAPWK